MRKVDIDSNYGQVAQTIENHYSGGRLPPPEGHPHGRSCPQCLGDTWRMTQWCVHCGADLFAIDREEHERRVFLRKTAVFGAAMLLCGAAWWIQSYLPPNWRVWAMSAGVIALLVAAGVVRD
jgi:hypothetical protein